MDDTERQEILRLLRILMDPRKDEAVAEGLAALAEEIASLRATLGRVVDYALRSSFEARAALDWALASVDCPVCEGPIPDAPRHRRLSDDFWHTGTLVRIACPHCGLVFGPVSVIRTPPARLAEDYRTFHAAHREGDCTEAQEGTFRALNPVPGWRYLNVACGLWREGLEALLAQGWDLYGFEPFLPFQHDRILTEAAALEGLRFDGLFTHNFLEHLQDPVDQFRRWNAMLETGGLMAHSTACLEYRFEFSNFHLFYFLGDSLEILARRTGFRILSRTDHRPDDPQAFTRRVVFRKEGPAGAPRP